LSKTNGILKNDGIIKNEKTETYHLSALCDSASRLTATRMIISAPGLRAHATAYLNANTVMVANICRRIASELTQRESALWTSPDKQM
jgi:hypothetical protein